MWPPGGTRGLFRIRKSVAILRIVLESGVPQCWFCCMFHDEIFPTTLYLHVHGQWIWRLMDSSGRLCPLQLPAGTLTIADGRGYLDISRLNLGRVRSNASNTITRHLAEPVVGSRSSEYEQIVTYYIHRQSQIHSKSNLDKDKIQYQNIISQRLIVSSTRSTPPQPSLLS